MNSCRRSKRSIWELLRAACAPVLQKQRHAFRAAGVERLESRRLLAATFASDPAYPGNFVVSFTEDAAATHDALALRIVSGQLQYQLNSGPFTNDLNSSTPGVQALSFGVISRIDISLLSGNDALTLDAGGGNVIPSLSGISYNGGTGTDAIFLSQDANYTLTDTTLTLSPGGVVSLSAIERASLSGGTSPNLMDASAFTGSVTMDGQGQDDTLIGGAGNDVLIGTQGSDLVDGRGGNDLLFSGNSGSTVSGGDGNDTLIGDNGKDFFLGQGGDDLLLGNNAADTLDGGDGNDTLEGALGNDQIIGGAGVDTVQAAGSVSFTLTDSILTGLGTDLLHGIEAAILTGGTNNNTLDCAAFTGDTTLNGGGGNDTLIGGSGDNVFFNNQGGNTTIVGGSGTNTSHLTPSGFVSLTEKGGLDELNFSTSSTGITIDLTKSGGTSQNVDGLGFTVSLNGTFENVVGTSFSDDVLGNDAENLIFGGLGADQIDGGAGSDIIFGGTATGIAGDDTSDIIFGGLGADQIDGGAGSDIIFGGTASGIADADSSNDIIFGGLGADEINGGAGSDIIFGGTATGIADADSSNDIIFGGLGSDQIDAGAGNDIIFGGTAGGISDLDGSNDIIYGGLGNDQIDAGAGNDIIFGGTAAGIADAEAAASSDIIFGGLGADQIDGGTGSDIIFGGTGGVLNGTSDQDASNDIIYGGLGADQVDAGAGSDIVFGGTGSPDTDTLAGSDLIFGGAGNDVLGGGNGDDNLVGGADDDTYLFIGTNLGHDTITEDANLGVDTLDFSGFGGAVTLDLALTALQVVSAGDLSLSFSSSTSIENVVGSRFADTILGNSRNNRLFGADQLDDRYTNPGGWNGVTQLVYLDFDSHSSLLVSESHAYTQAERDAIQARLGADYAAFHFQFTQAQPVSGSYASLFFNKTPVIDGQPQPGGLADELDFRNLNLGASAAIDVNSFLGGPNEPAATSENFVAFSATVAGHELGHLLGLRHLDSAGPIGFGIPAGVAPDDFIPPYPGPAQAFESNLHLMSSPASVGSSLFEAVGDVFFGAREAVKLAFNESGAAVAEAGGNNSLASAQLLNLVSLAVPNTILNGLHHARDFAVSATSLVGSIGLSGDASEDDYYSFTGRAGDLINIEVMSSSLDRILNPIDSIVRLYDALGNLIAYYSGAGVNDDAAEGLDSVLLDLVLPSDGIFYIQVDTFTDDGLGVPDTDTGEYELFIYRFDTGNATDGGDHIDGRAGDDSLTGGLGDDVLVGGAGTNVIDGGAGADTVIDAGDVDFALTDSSLTGSGSSSLFSVEAATLTGGAGANAFQIDGWTGSASIDGGSGTDTLIGANAASTWNITGPVAGIVNGVIAFMGVERLTGGAATDTLVGPDVSNTWNLDAANGGAVGNFTFTGMENVSGGSADDAFIFTTGGAVAGTIDGNGGANSLDYSAFTAGVTVNLTTGAATGAGGVSNFQHVFGGAGSDSLTGSAAANVLVGNAGNDALFGNHGRDILIGGLDSDLLDGGDDDDILLGARTSYDADRPALLAIAQEWSRTDLGYSVRVSHISGAVAGGLNGAFVLNATTVFDDNRTMDTLWGRGGIDWFIHGTRDDLMDRVPGETTTRI